MESSSQISELLEQIDMETYLSNEGIAFRKTRGNRGTQLNVRECPVCGNNKWKVYLNAETGLGNCFAGDHPPGQNYNKWTFIKAHLGVDDKFAILTHIKSVAREMGWRPKRRATIAVDLTTLKLPKSEPIPINGENLPYLEHRGIDAETARYFHLRYSENGEFWYQHEGKWRVQDYSKRVIIPIFDLEGRLVSFQGRDITGAAKQKYLFPPGFSVAGRHLYNGQNALHVETVVVGEGVFDVAAIKIAFDQEMELRHVVPIGTFGKHLSHGDEEGNDQLGRFLDLKRRGLRNVVLMWDSEPEALKAACEAAELLTGIGLRVRIAILPKGRDPNEIPATKVRECYWTALRYTRANALRISMGACWG